jgi:hypothetical protein
MEPMLAVVAFWPPFQDYRKALKNQLRTRRGDAKFLSGGKGVALAQRAMSLSFYAHRRK